MTIAKRGNYNIMAEKTIEEIEKDLDLIHKRHYLVVKGNDLIQKAQFQLTATQQKVICYIISLIKPDDKIFSFYDLSVKDFAELSGISEDNVYTEFKEIVEQLDQKKVWIKTEEKTFLFRWFSEAEYVEKKGILRVMLNSNMKAYLLQLQNRFTAFEIWNILSLSSKWSIRLYELFKSYEYECEKTFDYEELKEQLGATNYRVFADFKKRILEVAKREINLYTDIEIDYEVIKSGKEHKVKEIIFYIDKKSAIDGVLAYRKTIDKINKRNKEKTIKGQLRLNPDGTISEEL